MRFPFFRFIFLIVSDYDYSTVKIKSQTFVRILCGQFLEKGLQRRKKYAIIEESAREETPLGVGGYARRTRGMEKISRETRVKILTTPKMYGIIYL